MTSYLGFDSASTLIKMMTIAADCVFYFLPFFIAWSAAKRFKTDTALALMCAGFMLYPTMTAGLAEGASPMSLFGLPILLSLLRYLNDNGTISLFPASALGRADTETSR